jgi:hypothetical protein
MKALFNAILDGLTFTDLAGKRHPRTYTVLTGVILILLIALSLGVGLEHKSMMDEVQSTPIPVAVTIEPSEQVEPTLTPEEPCHSDPKNWTFLDIAPDDNFKRIEPVCVYEGLERSVAWAIAVRSGYTRAEAAKTLGFSELPMRQMSEVMALTNTKGPLSLAVSFTPSHPGFAEWRVGSDGKPAVAYALRGCFRTYKVVGNQTDEWNKDYPVICVLSEDSYGLQIVFQLDGQIFTSSAEPTRSFALFGYAGNGDWVWLGTQKEPKTDLKTMPSYREEAQLSAKQFDLPVWDAAWLEKDFEMSAKALPEDWQSHTQESDKESILNGLNEALK